MTGRAKASESWPDMKRWAVGLTPLVEANRAAFDNWMKAGDAMAKGALAISQEMAEFAQTRLREDIAACEALCKCQSPSDATECQREFAKTATAQYLDHANKLAGLMARLASANFAAAQHCMTEGARAVQIKAE